MRNMTFLRMFTVCYRHLSHLMPQEGSTAAVDEAPADYWLLSHGSQLDSTLSWWSFTIVRHGFWVEEKKLHGLSPRANYTDRATAGGRRSNCQICGERVPRGQRDRSLRPYSRFSGQEPLLFYQVAPQLYS
jgi:hypothetical protein